MEAIKKKMQAMKVEKTNLKSSGWGGWSAMRALRGHWCAKDKKESTKGLDKGECAIDTATNMTITSKMIIHLSFLDK